MLRKYIKKIVLGISLLSVVSLSGCSLLDSKFTDIKGNLIGNSFNVSVYNNSGSNILDVSGSKVWV